MGFNNECSGSIVLDIETIGSPECESFLEPVSAPANYKDAEKIAAYCVEKRQQQIERAGLEADLCEVVAVGVRVDDEPVRVMTRVEGDERALVAFAWAQIASRYVIGFNVLGFDLPVLIRRAQLMGVPYTPLSLDRYRTPHVDLLERLSFNGKLTYRSLSFYCKRFGIPVTDETSGKDIAAMVAANDWATVHAHCRADVEKTTALAQRLGWLMRQAEAISA